MTQSQPNGEPQVQPEGEGPIVPIGTSIPHDQFVSDLPLRLWDLHTVESWAMAVLQEAMDESSRPPQPPLGRTQNRYGFRRATSRCRSSSR
jgi:hypothetical protein